MGRSAVGLPSFWLFWLASLLTLHSDLILVLERFQLLLPCVKLLLKLFLDSSDSLLVRCHGRQNLTDRPSPDDDDNNDERKGNT